MNPPKTESRAISVPNEPRIFVKNTVTLQELQVNFGIYPVPDLLAGILQFEQAVGVEHSLTSYIDATQLPYEEIYGEEASRLIHFAYCEHSQSGYCLWNQHNNPDPETWPVVIFGGEGDLGCVARSLREFFIITASDRPLFALPRIGLAETSLSALGEMQEDESWPSPLNARYREYLSSLGLNLSQDPSELVRLAQEEVNPSLFAWEAPLALAYQVRYFREHEQDHVYMLLIKERHAAPNENLPGHFFSGAGSDTAWFEILGEKRPSALELSIALQAVDPDYYLGDYNEEAGTGSFVAVDSYAPEPGVMAAPISRI
ncbi:hypothetical protein [Pseudomonas amygdali]|uniref:SMI1/KNR4 family protein n=1 Tax=Pseudomonas amygdali pv. lachrymans TaxID=53707 RepID=A0ABR5KQY9_PSEAV|nr:hypothetical protein [Pseudomonas amygdali]KPC17227.1 Uncharacterized protein AC499_0429 [Pseudomonas amygdali pv. lachrymans]KPC18186.1 Uncharacterized protein AC499_1388 [Pseudomonas amygdali pv. lachrymans]RMT06545.1 hypothetical protein ALP54_03694 [Pseudomonas amygdali pv. lachrymans]